MPATNRRKEKNGERIRIELLLSEAPEQSKLLSINEKIHLFFLCSMCIAFRDSSKYEEKSLLSKLIMSLGKSGTCRKPYIRNNDNYIS